MRVTLKPCNIRFYKRLLFMALVGVCQMAYGTLEMWYRSVVTNVLDATHVMVDWRYDPYPDSKNALGGGSVLLDGIAVPGKGSPEEAALLDVLKRTLLNKKVNVKELLDCGESRGGSIYVTDDPRRRVPEDNVNLMLVREGFARFNRRLQSDDGVLGGMAEAQRLAQEERKGIWAHGVPDTVQEVTPEIVRPIPLMRSSSVVTNVPDANRVALGVRRLLPDGLLARPGYTVPLDGIAAPEKGSPEEDTLRDAVEKVLLDKRVNVIEIWNMRNPLGSSIYVTDVTGHFAPEDNVNLMLVRDGFARFSGELNSTDELLGGMAEAQRLAQEERKGIWANYGQEATPEPAQPPVAIETTPPDSVPVTDTQSPPEPKETKATLWQLPLLIGIIAIIGAITAWRYLRKK